jgi:hypothetical protein
MSNDRSSRGCAEMVPPPDDAPAVEQAADDEDARRARVERRQEDQDRTLAAMQALEAALGSAAPGRESSWRDDVLEALTVLAETTRAEAENASRPDSLLSDIARSQPRLRNRVRGLRLQYRQLQDAFDSVRREILESASTVEFADLRQRLAWVLTGLRHQRARESDLIYEAYYDAFHSDLPRDAAAGPD